MALYAHQRAAVRFVDRRFRDRRNSLVVMPTGTGKTVVFAAVIRRWLDRHPGHRVLVVAHRIELLDQAMTHLLAAGVRQIEIEKGAQRASKDARVILASVATLACRRLAGAAPALVVVDEAHRSAAPSYLAIRKRYPRARFLGVTATDERLDGVGLTMFDVASGVHRYELLDAISAGHAAPIVQKSVVLDMDLGLIKRSHGDLDKKQLSKILKSAKLLQGVARPVLETVGARRTIVFSVSVAHAKELARILNRRRPGIAKAVAGDDLNRTKTIAAFRAGEFQILVNCDLVTEGFDCPEVSCIVMARPTLSRRLYLQCIGRGARIWAGKPDCLVLDFCGNAGRHAIFDAYSALGDALKPEVLRAAKAIGEAEPDLAAHLALERARALPDDVLASYRVADVDPSPPSLCAVPGCGLPVSRGGLRPSHPRFPRTCGHKHSGVLKRLEALRPLLAQVRPCRSCGVALQPGATERPSNFARRATCGLGPCRDAVIADRNQQRTVAATCGQCGASMPKWKTNYLRRACSRCEGESNVSE